MGLSFLSPACPADLQISTRKPLATVALGRQLPLFHALRMTELQDRHL